MELVRDDIVRALYEKLEVRDADEAAGDDARPTLTGHFAVFNEWTEIDSFWEGRFMERIAPGAFKKTMREQRDTVKVTFNHGHDVLGNYVLGPIEELHEDEVGAYYEVSLLDGIPELLMNGLRAGQYGASFRFSIVKETFVEKPDASDYNPRALPERTINEVRLHEFGPVTFPAYPEATAGVRSLTDNFVLARAIAQPDRLREVLASAGAAALQDKQKPEPQATTSAAGSRSTQPIRDFLRDGKETPSWLL